VKKILQVNIITEMKKTCILEGTKKKRCSIHIYQITFSCGSGIATTIRPKWDTILGIKKVYCFCVGTGKLYFIFQAPLNSADGVTQECLTSHFSDD